MSNENPEFWAFEDADYVNTNNIAELLQDYVDSLCDDDEIPATFKLIGYDQRVLKLDEKIVHANNILENLLDTLDNEYRNYDDVEPTKETEAMKTAALKFVNTVLYEFNIMDLVKVAEKEVKILDYLSKSDLEC